MDTKAIRGTLRLSLLLGGYWVRWKVREWRMRRLSGRA
jgi:hypothetical protein